MIAWALNAEELDHFAPCKPTLADRFPHPGKDPSEYIAAAKLRPQAQLFQEADTLYMLHWSAVEANLRAERDSRVVLPRVSFRRHAADWIIGVAESWDEVPLDT